MANIDHERKRITAVLLFYGPPGAGKTTSLYALARHLPPGTHGKVAPLQPGDDRLLRLDYRPHDHELVYGYQLSFRLVTCPGAVEVDLVRPVLAAADAVMFVADSASNSLNANVKALDLLDKMARSAGRRLENIPTVFMYNKRDLRDALEIRLLESRLNRQGGNYLAASAIRGQGVLEAVQRLTATVAVQLRTELQSEPGIQGSTAATVAHGTTFQQARALQGGEQDVDDVTAVSTAQAAPKASSEVWDLGNDDKTEVNPQGGGWDVTGRAQAPAPAARRAEPARRAPQPQPRAEPQRQSMSAPRRRGPQPRTPAPARPDPREARAARVAHGATGRASVVEDSVDFTDISPYEAQQRAAQDHVEPVHGGASGWRTPAQFADIDSDDHTAPYTDFASEVSEVPQERVQLHSDRRDGPASALSARRPSARSAAPRQQSSPRVRTPSRPAARQPVRPTPTRGGGGSLRTAGAVQEGRARRVESPSRPVPMATAPAPRASAPAPEVRPVGGADGGGAFTKTMAINALGREAEVWEAGIEQSGHPVRVRIPDLAGYVVSRIGTPRAASRRTVRVPLRATHMDTLVPQDFLVDLEFRGSGPGSAPVVSARKTKSNDAKMVPLSWLIGSVGAVVVALVILWLGFYANG